MGCAARGGAGRGWVGRGRAAGWLVRLGQSGGGAGVTREDSFCSGDGKLSAVGVAALPALLFLLSSPTLDFLNPANYFKGTIHSFFPPIRR